MVAMRMGTSPSAVMVTEEMEFSRMVRTASLVPKRMPRSEIWGMRAAQSWLVVSSAQCPGLLSISRGNHIT